MTTFNSKDFLYSFLIDIGYSIITETFNIKSPNTPTTTTTTTSPNDIDKELKQMLFKAIKRTNTTVNVLLTSFILIKRLKHTNPSLAILNNNGSDSNNNSLSLNLNLSMIKYKLMLIAIIISYKTTNDNCYYNKSWYILNKNKLALHEINKMEMEFLNLIKFNLKLSYADYHTMALFTHKQLSLKCLQFNNENSSCYLDIGIGIGKPQAKSNSISCLENDIVSEYVFSAFGNCNNSLLFPFPKPPQPQLDLYPNINPNPNLYTTKQPTNPENLNLSPSLLDYKKYTQLYTTGANMQKSYTTNVYNSINSTNNKSHNKFNIKPAYYTVKTTTSALNNNNSSSSSTATNNATTNANGSTQTSVELKTPSLSTSIPPTSNVHTNNSIKNNKNNINISIKPNKNNSIKIKLITKFNKLISTMNMNMNININMDSSSKNNLDTFKDNKDVLNRKRFGASLKGLKKFYSSISLRTYNNNNNNINSTNTNNAKMESVNNLLTNMDLGVDINKRDCSKLYKGRKPNVQTIWN